MVSKSEDNTSYENSAIVFIEFIESLGLLLDNNSNIDISETLKQLYESYPHSFPIMVYYCKTMLLKDEYDESNMSFYREILSLLSNSVNKKLNLIKSKLFYILSL